MGNNNSPLNQNPHLPFVPGPERKNIQKRSSLFFGVVLSRTGKGWGQLQINKASHNWGGQDIQLVVLHISFQVSKGGRSKTKWNIAS